MMKKTSIAGALVAAGMMFAGPALAADAVFNVPLDCEDHDEIVVGILTMTNGVAFADMDFNEMLTVTFDQNILTPEKIVATLAEFGFEAIPVLDGLLAF